MQQRLKIPVARSCNIDQHSYNNPSGLPGNEIARKAAAFVQASSGALNEESTGREKSGRQGGVKRNGLHNYTKRGNDFIRAIPRPAIGLLILRDHMRIAEEGFYTLTIESIR